MPNSCGVRWTARAVDVDRPLLEIEADRPDLDHRLARRRRPAQRGAQAREQLADRERLRHVVVGARVERGDLLVLVADRRDDDDRRLAPRAQLAAHLGAGAVGQQQVEDDRVGRLQRRGAERLLGGRRRVDVVAGAAQVRRRARAGTAARRRRPGCASLTAGGSAASVSRAHVPPPSRGSSSSCTPFTSAKPRAIARPRPAPLALPACPRANGSSSDAGSAPPRPLPRSSTSSEHLGPRPVARSSTAPAPENLSALSSRFTSTRCS